MPRDRDQAPFARMLELLVATPRASKVPSIVGEEAEDIADFHGSQDARGRREMAGMTRRAISSPVGARLPNRSACDTREVTLSLTRAQASIPSAERNSRCVQRAMPRAA